MSSNYYHKTYSDAIQTAMKDVKKRGFDVDQDDYDRQVTFGKGKPSEGKTAIHSIRLTKNGKPIKKTLEVQVYNRGNSSSTPFERNHYIGEEISHLSYAAFIDEAYSSETVDNMESALMMLKKQLEKDFGLEVVVGKSTLGGKEKTSFSLKIFGRKSGWKNGIAQNSNISMIIMIWAYENSVENKTFGYKMKDAGMKPIRKFKYTDRIDLTKKLLAYFDKNKAAITSLNKDVNEELTVDQEKIRKKFVQAMKKDSAQDLRTRHGKRWKDVMYAVAHRNAQVKQNDL